MPTIRKNNAIPQTRMPRLRRIPRTVRGPKELGLWITPERVVGPGEPPEGFVSGTTSASEWVAYWACATIFEDPPDPRKPPFEGGRIWRYQVPFEGGRSKRGGSVMDFLIDLPAEMIGIRLSTERYHEAADPRKKAFDRAQAMSLERRNVRVEDLYEQDIIADTTGNAAIRRIIELLGGWERVSPTRAGTFRRVRPNTI